MRAHGLAPPAPMATTIESLACRLALLACLWASGCNDRDARAAGTTDYDGTSTTDAAGSSSGGDGVSACVIEAREPVRRLSAFEYTRALRDLVGVEIDEASLPPSSVTAVFATQDAALGSSPLLVDGQFDATSLAAAAVLTRMQAGEAEAFLGCALTDAECVDTWLAAFGKRAYRRPLADDERSRLRVLYDEVAAIDGEHIAVAATVQAILLSPRFGFHVEEHTDQGVPDDYAIASRLSFLLWGSAPDDVLLDAADRGVLHEPNQRAAQAQRLLADPRAVDKVVRIYRELLDLDVVATLDPVDPRWSDALRDEMDAEIDRFVAATIFEQGGSLAALMTSRWVDAGPALGALYELAPGEHELPPERAGLLTRAAFLASTSSGTAPSPVRRGLAVLDRLTCTTVAPPPPSIPEIPSPAEGITNRDRYASHTADPACAGCHLQFDPIGFTFEHFDAIGAYRSVDNGQPVDASGEVLGTAVDGAAALSVVLANSDVVASCTVTQWLHASLGHALGEGESCVRDELAARFFAQGGDLRALLVDLAASPLLVE